MGINWKLIGYLAVVTGLLTYVLYQYHRSRPPDAARIAHCEALVQDMPENSREEINRSINTYMDCLRE